MVDKGSSVGPRATESRTRRIMAGPVGKGAPVRRRVLEEQGSHPQSGDPPSDAPGDSFSRFNVFLAVIHDLVTLLNSPLMTTRTYCEDTDDQERSVARLAEIVTEFRTTPPIV